MPAKKATAKKADKKTAKKAPKKTTKKATAKKPAKKTVKKTKKTTTQVGDTTQNVVVAPVVSSTGVVTMNPVQNDVAN